MTVEFLDEALEEFAEAVLWYDEREPGLGRRFRTQMERIIRRIAADPLRPQLRPGGYRRVNGVAFPYCVAYNLRQDRIIIAAVAHVHRRPGHWKSRMTVQPSQ
jgi:plasmid stabilization system protein ParE